MPNNQPITTQQPEIQRPDSVLRSRARWMIQHLNPGQISLDLLEMGDQESQKMRLHLEAVRVELKALKKSNAKTNRYR